MKTILLNSTLLIILLIFEIQPVVSIDSNKNFETLEKIATLETDIKVPISGHYEIWDGCTVLYEGYVTVNVEKEKITRVSVGISLAGEGCGQYNGLQFGASWGVNSYKEDGRPQIIDFANSQVEHSLGNDLQLQKLLIEDINSQL